jgi:hypothetical protein
MLSDIFKIFESALRAAIYLLVLIMGVSVATLGAYVVFFLCYRSGQLFWDSIFKSRWMEP